MNRKRLLKLARHLESGELGHKIFDFGQFNNAILGKCGTAGCAIGELPILFPNSWIFHTASGAPLLKVNSSDGTFKDAMKFFDIDRDMAHHLFAPFCQSYRYGGRLLRPNATRGQVAANIREFVSIMRDKSGQ